ncbi:MAG: hypothetical protein ACJ72N_10900 [Labedaea sp.]
MRESADTVEPRDVPATEPLAAPRRVRGPARLWPEVSGALALGLGALAAVVLGLQIVAWLSGVPGPGPLAVAGQLAAAALAVLIQRLADRRRGWARAAAVLGVLAIAGLALWLFWWA